MNEMSTPKHQIFRTRHEVRRRLLTVTETERITPRMLRIHFVSPDLHDFVSPGIGDHVKLFLPAPDGERCMRDYTPRAFDTQACTLVIDFALHEAGPATAWAMAAQPGNTIEIGGPRGSMIVPDDFDWYLLIGDETALPAIGRQVESLRAGVPVTTIVAVDSAADQLVFETRADWQAVWAIRTGSLQADADLLRNALAERGPLPGGDGYVWIAAEARAARTLRTYAYETLGHPKAWLKAAGYWTMGLADAHEPIGD
jgi:NADPH-dependent ferric siderophore reductase